MDNEFNNGPCNRTLPRCLQVFEILCVETFFGVTKNHSMLKTSKDQKLSSFVCWWFTNIDSASKKAVLNAFQSHITILQAFLKITLPLEPSHNSTLPYFRFSEISVNNIAYGTKLMVVFNLVNALLIIGINQH